MKQQHVGNKNNFFVEAKFISMPANIILCFSCALYELFQLILLLCFGSNDGDLCFITLYYIVIVIKKWFM